MSLELVNTLATLGTFLVIAATAIAAIVQLRHMRSSNQIAALNELRGATEAPEFRAARHFVLTELRTKMQDPAFRYQIAQPAARNDETRLLESKINEIGSFYENIGVLVKVGLVDTDLVLDTWAISVADTWERLAPVIAIRRRTYGPAFAENFEYVAVLAQDWMAAHPKGTYPASVRRMDFNDEWLEADRQYAASLAQA